LPIPSVGSSISRRDGVRLGIPVAENLEEVHQVVLLLGTKLEIPDLAVRLSCGSRLGGSHPEDILDVVKYLRRRKERRVARGARPDARLDDPAAGRGGRPGGRRGRGGRQRRGPARGSPDQAAHRAALEIAPTGHALPK